MEAMMDARAHAWTMVVSASANPPRIRDPADENAQRPRDPNAEASTLNGDFFFSFFGATSRLD